MSDLILFSVLNSQWFTTSLRVKSKILSMTNDLHPCQICACLSHLFSYRSLPSLHSGQCNLIVLLTFRGHFPFQLFLLLGCPPSSSLPNSNSDFTLNVTSSRNFWYPQVQLKAHITSHSGTSLVVQGLRIHLPTGAWVSSLIGEDPTWLRAAKLGYYNWTHTLQLLKPRARALQQEKPPQWEAHEW